MKLAEKKEREVTKAADFLLMKLQHFPRRPPGIKMLRSKTKQREVTPAQDDSFALKLRGRLSNGLNSVQLRKKIVQELDQRQELKVKLREKQEETKRRKIGSSIRHQVSAVFHVPNRARCSAAACAGPLQVRRGRSQVDTSFAWCCPNRMAGSGSTK